MRAKKFLAMILTLAMLASLNAAFALNVRAEDGEAKDKNIEFKAEANDETGEIKVEFKIEFKFDWAEMFEPFADQLKALGLFLGTGTGYALERAPTRDEAATMLVRLLGKEAQAKEENSAHPFTDVPEWADPYVGYLYANGLTKGVSAELFGSKDLCSLQMFCTFVLRALGYADTGEAADFTYDKAIEFALELPLFTEMIFMLSDPQFTRAGCVFVMSMALQANVKGAETTLLAKLVGEGAVDKEAADAYLEFIAQMDGPGPEPEIKPEEKPEPEKKPEEKPEPETKPEEKPKENLTEEDLQTLINTLSAGLMAGTLECNVGLMELMAFTSQITIKGATGAVKETTDDGIEWTIGVKEGNIEAIVCVFFDAKGEFIELIAAGMKAGEKFEIKINKK